MTATEAPTTAAATRGVPASSPKSVATKSPARGASFCRSLRAPIVTVPWVDCSIVQLPSHRRSCGQMRPQISGIVEVLFDSS